VKLVDLNPRWIGAGGDDITESGTGNPVLRREGVALGFDCPCGCDQRVAVFVDPPVDGLGPYIRDAGINVWQREGSAFETLTLKPSILRSGGCGWHGFITNGEAITV